MVCCSTVNKGAYKEVGTSSYVSMPVAAARPSAAAGAGGIGIGIGIRKGISLFVCFVFGPLG